MLSLLSHCVVSLQGTSEVGLALSASTRLGVDTTSALSLQSLATSTSLSIDRNSILDWSLLTGAVQSSVLSTRASGLLSTNTFSSGASHYKLEKLKRDKSDDEKLNWSEFALSYILFNLQPKSCHLPASCMAPTSD